ncbi:MAG: hypothetical protein Ct9H90mP13_11410 [Pseudomonadota bacterium]|nr:MAG: hypothetical protein Ct9H90mP13_11410 [Pseudomonadota bacterium]
MNLDTPKKIVLAVRESLEIIIRACSNDLKEGYDGEIFNVSLPCDYGFGEKKVNHRLWYCLSPYDDENGGQGGRGVYIGATPPEVLKEAMENIYIGKIRDQKKRTKF